MAWRRKEPMLQQPPASPNSGVNCGVLHLDHLTHWSLGELDAILKI